ncbi:MAG: aquaporin family protein [Myxococcales bacterium]|nr:aquaporin family protein [Myxococcales bacterium]
MTITLPRKLAAEFLGTLLLVVAVVGSGILASDLAGDAAAITLFINSVATGCALVVLIWMFGGVSGAHLNPVVSLAALLLRQQPLREALAYVGAQVAGSIAGIAVVHTMFGLPWLDASRHMRSGGDMWFSEVVATFGLVGAIIAIGRQRPQAVPVAVGLYITAAYWFTGSSAFANPALTLARALTDTYCGIRLADVPAYGLAQVAGAALATAVFGWLVPVPRAAES